MSSLHSHPILPPLLLLSSLSADHTSLIPFLSLALAQSPLSLFQSLLSFLFPLSFHYNINRSLSLFHSVFSSIFPFLLGPFPVSPLEPALVQSDPLVVRLSLSLAPEQHFGDLLIGLELSIPSGWITEHRCKSPPAWRACRS